MAIIKKVRGYEPVIGENCFLADNAVVVGDVTMGKDCSIWFNAVLRGDVNTITIGNRVNIQDNSVIHTLYEKSVTEIGNDVSIGHNVVVHGAKIGDMALIGMGSIILDHADVLLNASVQEISEKLYFDYTSTVADPEALYSEMVPGGNIQVLVNTTGSESKVNIEALFSAVLLHKGVIKNMFNK